MVNTMQEHGTQTLETLYSKLQHRQVGVHRMGTALWIAAWNPQYTQISCNSSLSPQESFNSIFI